MRSRLSSAFDPGLERPGAGQRPPMGHRETEHDQRQALMGECGVDLHLGDERDDPMVACSTTRPRKTIVRRDGPCRRSAA